jgi:hypothetical protein
MHVRRGMSLAFFALMMVSAPLVSAQTSKTLTNTDILTMTKEGLDSNLIVKEIQVSASEFDVSPQALIDLKNAGVTQSVMEAMLTAQSIKPPVVAANQAVVTETNSAGMADLSKPICKADSGCLLRDATEVTLKFAADLNSKTAHEGDPVEFLLDNDLKVGETVVVPKGSHAVATVSTAKKAGMMGRPGDLSVQLQYLVAGGTHVRLRGTKGKEGESKTGETVALTVLFGPIGLIKHGKDVDIPAGTPLTAYVDQDTWLAAAH